MPLRLDLHIISIVISVLLYLLSGESRCLDVFTRYLLTKVGSTLIRKGMN